MPEYTVTCKSCGSISTGNSKWIPLSSIQKAGKACQTCGSPHTEITLGWPNEHTSSSNNVQLATKTPAEKVAEEHQKRMDEYDRKTKANHRSVLYNLKMLFFGMVLPVMALGLIGQACSQLFPSSGTDSGEYCSPGLYGPEC